MIKPHQLRAARALLDWTRADLAAAADVSDDAIAKFEKGLTRFHEGTMDALVAALTERNIEFVEDGVRIRNDRLTVFEGQDNSLKVLEDIFFTLKGKEDELLLLCGSDELSPPFIIDSFEKIRRAKIKMRSIISEKDTYILGNLTEYRLMPDKYFNNNAQLIYADKVATSVDDKDSIERIFVIRNASYASTMRNIFNLLWEQGGTPEKSTASVRYADVGVQ